MSLGIKQDARAQLVELLERELATMSRAALAARAAATHEESKAEGDKDTRSIELGYLAAAQAQRASVIEQELLRLNALELREFAVHEPVSVGALVDIEQDGRVSRYFLVPVAGGATLRVGGEEIRALATTAPLGSALLRAEVGDVVELEAPAAVKEYAVLAVC